MQIARKIRSVEAAKIGLIQQVAETFRGIQSGSEHEVTKALGDLIGVVYFLAKQLDVPFSVLDREAAQSVPKVLGDDPLDAADYQAIQRYLDSKR